MIISAADPRVVTMMDVRPDKSGALALAGRSVFSVPSWASDGTIVAMIGEDAGDTIALIDVTEPGQAKVTTVLWKQGNGLDVKPSFPVYPEEDWQAWVCWGPPWRSLKFFDAANLGEIILGRAPSP
jgi:hypothetical protein